MFVPVKIQGEGETTLTEAMIVAVVTAGASIVCQLLISNKTAAVMRYRLDELEKKVMKHNNLVETIYRLEEQMKVANHRIADLEEWMREEE